MRPRGRRNRYGPSPPVETRLRNTLTVHELEVFLLLAESRNFRIAAEQAHVSQPALSRTLQSAEWKLKVRLFDRNTRKVELTSAGQELLPIAKRVVSEFNSSLSDLSEFVAGRRGTVTIASLPSAAAALLPRAMAEFEQSHPRVVVALHPSPAEKALSLVMDGTANFALSPAPARLQDFDYEPLMRDDFVLICARHDPLASCAQVSWAALAEQPFLASGSETSVRSITDRVMNELGMQVASRYESSSLAVLGAMTAAGLGITVIPRMALRLMDASSLAIVPLTDPPVHRELGIVTRKGRSLPAAVTLFMDVLRRHQQTGAGD